MISADVPGMSRGDIKVQVSPDRVLSISGERRSESQEGSEEEGTLRVERSYGSFLRRFRLPDNVDVEGAWWRWSAAGLAPGWRGAGLVGPLARSSRRPLQPPALPPTLPSPLPLPPSPCRRHQGQHQGRRADADRAQDPGGAAQAD